MRRPSGQMKVWPMALILVLCFLGFCYLEFFMYEDEHDHSTSGLHLPPGRTRTDDYSYPNRGASTILWKERPDLWAYDEPDDPDDEVDDATVKDDFTFLMGAVNINRTGHLGHSGPHAFEDDYLANLKRWARFFEPDPIRIRFQQRYDDHMSDVTKMPHVDVKHLEIEDLRNFKFFKDIERIRTSPWWLKATSWLEGVPQGWSMFYNPLVMQKIYMLYELAKENPFNTKYFVWLDSGGICTPNLQHFGKDKFKHKLRHFMDGFLITRSDYAGSNEIHGCMRRLMIKLTANHPAFVSKGWIMGGTRKSIGRVIRVYEKMLQTTLDMGCLGTEETVFTILAHTHPHLFHGYVNSDPDWPFNGLGFCAFLDSNHKWERPAIEPETKWITEQKERERLAEQTNAGGA